MPVRFPKKGNPLYPLPPDYAELSTAGRRKARLNAVALRETPDDMVHAWSFFRSWYLNHEEAYFYKNFKDSPYYHYEMIGFYRQYALNAIAAPRAGAKSTVIGTELPLLEMVSPSVPGMDIIILLSADKYVEQRFDKFMIQLDENPRILEDFGRLRPGHGAGIWNRHHLRLSNHVSCMGASIDGKKRGQRPDLAIIDDPEYDPDTGTDLSRVNRNFNDMLKRQVLGMLEPGSRLFWIGTLLSRRAFLYHMITSGDPTFLKWNRKIYAAIEEDASGNEQIVWSGKYTKEYLDERRAQMGEGAFRTEFLNDPRGEDETILSPDPLLTGYDLTERPDDPDELPQNQKNPLACRTEIEFNDCYIDKDGVVQTEAKRRPFGEHVKGLKRYISVDYAPTQTSLSDFSCILVWGMDKKNTLWVLDGWHGRVRSPVLIKKIWEFAERWHTNMVGVEAVSVQDEIRQQVADYMASIAETGTWTPRVVPIRYPPGVSKEDRIGGLEWRFNKGRIKLPEYLRQGHSTLHELFEQIENFTPDLSLLPHDDVIDTLSMAHYLLPSGYKERNPGKADPETIPEMILAGQQHLPGLPGVSLASALLPHERTVEVMDALFGMRDDDELRHPLHGSNYVGPFMGDDF